MKEEILSIIVVDDDEINLYLLNRFLRELGHVVKTFNGGISAWEYLQQNPHKVDMVILDKMMDDMDGIEVIKHMKSNMLLRNIPIIMQSGHAFPEDVEEGLTAGADRYLVKPYEMKEMLSEMRMVIDQDYGYKYNKNGYNNKISNYAQ